MPTYDYECQACGHSLEAFHSMSAEPLTTCPDCGKDELRRQIGTGAGIVFKGSGFYETDYKRSGSGGKEGSSSADTSEKKPASDKGGEKKASSGGSAD